jgi:hypothetical protein
MLSMKKASWAVAKCLFPHKRTIKSDRGVFGEKKIEHFVTTGPYLEGEEEGVGDLLADGLEQGTQRGQGGTVPQKRTKSSGQVIQLKCWPFGNIAIPGREGGRCRRSAGRWI